MIDFIATCRICLEDDAMYPIFDNNEEFESVYAQLAVCIQEKLEDLEGYPRNICLKCKNTSETICKFMATFENTCEILRNKILQIKSENNGEYINDDELESEHIIYELQLDYAEPKVEKKDSTELLESLSHLTVKRIKLETSFDSQEIACIENDSNIKRKTGHPRKTDTKSGKTACIVNENKVKRKRGRPRKTDTKIGKEEEEKAGAKPASEDKALPIKDATKQATVTKKEDNAVSNTNSSEPGEEKKEEADRSYLKLKSIKRIAIGIHQNKASAEMPKLCDLCGKEFESASRLARHKVSGHQDRSHKCTQCPKAYFTKRNLNLHIQVRHENVRNFFCDYCGKSFFAKWELMKHINVVHLKKKKKVFATYRCGFCEKTFSYKQGATIHERAVHTGERPATCNVCTKSFTHESYLKEHMRLHTGETPFKCLVCARGYAQRGNLKSHMRNHKISEMDPETLAKIRPNHLRVMKPSLELSEKQDKSTKAHSEPVLCYLCGATFSEKGYLNHVKTNHTEKKFKCTKCPKQYISKKELDVHIKRHGNIRDFICDMCGKSYFRRKILAEHIRKVHLGKRINNSRKCRFCDKTFSGNRNRTVHERSVHTGERPALCKVCGSSFFDIVYLKEHMRLHTGETPFKCPVCSRGYAQRGNMKSHMRNHKISELDPETLAKIKPSYFKFLRP